MKKVLGLFVILLGVFCLVGCGSTENIEGSLSDIMDSLYAGIDEENLPRMLETHELTEENFEYYAFSSDIKYKEAVFSESMTGSVPHSIVLIRLEDAKDASSVVSKIKENANPRKWICVEAKNVYVESKGDLVVLIMTDNLDEEENTEIGPVIKKNFENLK